MIPEFRCTCLPFLSSCESAKCRLISCYLTIPPIPPTPPAVCQQGDIWSHYSAYHISYHALMCLVGVKYKLILPICSRVTSLTPIRHDNNGVLLTLRQLYVHHPTLDCIQFDTDLNWYEKQWWPELSQHPKVHPFLSTVCAFFPSNSVSANRTI